MRMNAMDILLADRVAIEAAVLKAGGHFSAFHSLTMVQSKRTHTAQTKQMVFGKMLVMARIILRRDKLIKVKSEGNSSV